MSERAGNLKYVAPVFRVADLARSLSYYCDQLGFAKEFYIKDLDGHILGFVQPTEVS